MRCGLPKSEVELNPDIPHILELKDPALKVRRRHRVRLTPTELTGRAAAAMERILDSIKTELAETRSLGQPIVRHGEGDRSAGVATVQRSIWAMAPTLLRSSLSTRGGQPQIGNAWPSRGRTQGSQNPAGAGQRADHSSGRGSSSGSADFYSYRYLATEGFPARIQFSAPANLCVYARRRLSEGAKATFLQRARFLAIAEFGPRSLIYHEGRAYRVSKARLPADLRTPDGRLVTTRLFVCDNCGAAHADEPERCQACGEAMGAGAVRFRNLRIDNVETAPAERITANDEERQRRGFDIQTVFTWPIRDGAPDVETAIAKEAGGPCLTYRLCVGRLISRVNKGLRRRRREKPFSVLGLIRQSAGGSKGPDDDEGDAPDVSPRSASCPSSRITRTPR